VVEASPRKDETDPHKRNKDEPNALMKSLTLTTPLLKLRNFIIVVKPIVPYTR